MSDTFWLRVLRFLPRNLLSRAFGWFAALRRPRWLAGFMVRHFARRFDVSVDEAERSLGEYDSLLDFFTRTLRDGVRPVDMDENALVSPVDGTVGACGFIESDRLLQAKGMSYSLEALLGDEEAVAKFGSGAYATLYLSPRDYHRIHSPESGGLISSLYEPGTLWPVNPPAVRTIPNLFAVNERVTTIIGTAGGQVAVVMVGATNVGSIRLAYSDLVTNRGGRRQKLDHDNLEVQRGGHLATFEMGSTVVLLVEDPTFSWSIKEGDTVRMGQGVGRTATRSGA